MEYTIQKVARLAGVSTRTLRYYDEIGLLRPTRLSSSGYRIYGAKEVDALQQILFFRELGYELSAILRIMSDPAFDQLDSLTRHLEILNTQRARLDLLIGNVMKTIEAEQGGKTMSDKEKFEGFKQKLLDENEAKYGKEIREKYGEETVNKSNAKMMNLTQEEYEAMQAMSEEILTWLEACVKDGLDPAGEEGKKVAALHKKWLGFTWPSYSKEAHLGLTEMYVADERFTAHYDTKVPGCAAFLKAAVEAWAGEI